MTTETTVASESTPDLSTSEGMESAALDIADSALPEENLKEEAAGDDSVGKPGEKAPVSQVDPKEPTATPAAVEGPTPAPDTLTGEAKAEWDTWTPVAQQEFLKREADIRGYIAETKLPVELGNGYLDVVGPYLDVYRAYGQNPVQMTEDLHRYHAVIMFGTPEQKANVLLGLATDAGIDLRQIAQFQGQGIPQRAQEDRRLAMLSSELTQVKSRLAQEDGAKMEQQIDKMWNDPEAFPYFQDLAPAMIELYKSNPQMPIETAYRTALASNPKLLEVITTKKAEVLAARKLEADRKKAEAARKAKGTRLDSSSPTRPASGRGDALLDLDSILAEELDAINSR